ncbi:PHD finger protein rhinoceros isoform X1 [Papilio machaon]|uniref:PHD finger protein rhinoceros isoform X1 n=1 Tax=Papilio machaon TaxID=76193 RepID=UPI001E665305|nr:PHD finger protein rhinoceros isoform X1 [Papilio machaon]XP_014366475.2 PHD finger protein rhinoceros isoform X1 [Papilio machaon]
MSLRGTKRASGVRSEEAGKCKRRRTDPEDALWQLPPVSDLKMSSIYNRSASEAPAELFRKDLISAMKLPDSEPLTPSEYWIITDTWKQDWERGVQVPVNPDSLPAPKVKIIENPLPSNFEEFKLPKDKYIHLSRDAHYQADKHHLSATPALAEAACSYDLDATDTAWLKLLNAERARAGASAVTEDQLEKVIEDLEVRTWDKIQAIMKSEEGLGIEYDENVICDVCRSPDSEDGNEMVFCDSCNICVHQACYGITVIPDGTYGHGQWLCRPCGAGVRPTCALCPNLGGAMKCTPNGHKWAHVSCVLWIPEVSIGCAEKMEPITKISSIPPSRWSLVCVLCRERKGACIQCSVKTCKTAYHVTCAFKHGLEMRAIIEDENADDGVKLRSYCQKHSVNSKKEKCPGSGSEEEEVKRKRRKDMTSEEKTQARAARLQEIEREFDRHVSVKDISSHLLDVDQDAINYIYNYWKLKRRAGHNRPLLPPKSDDSELLTHRQEQADLDKMKMFVQLRQDLERVRNLCYMVSRREKLSRSFFRMREQTFHKQVAVLSSEPELSGVDLAAIIEANHGPSIYDRLYSHPNAPDHKNDFDEILARIAPQDSSDEKKKDRNGLVKGQKASNPYKKHYVNGSRRSESMYSGLSSGDSSAENNRSTKYRGRAIASSTDEDVKKPSSSPKKKISPKGKGKRSPKKPERKKKKIPQSKAVVESSSEDESYKMSVKKDKSRSKTLQQMEKEMDAGKSGLSGTDSGDLMPMRSTRNRKFSGNIYSDSSDDTDSEKIDHKSAKQNKGKTIRSRSEGSPSGIDSQQGLPRTKAAMKQFGSTHPEKKSDDKPAPKKRGRKPSNKEKKPSTPVKTHESDDEARNKENIKLSKQKDNPSDLIVPQRQAAKKASENMRSTTAVKREESSTEKQASSDESRAKSKSKTKGKDGKDNASKSSSKKSSKDIEKEPIAYVPQRQAAKKAAAHIKSGLGSKLPVIDPSDSDKRRENDKSDTTKSSPKKNEAKISKPSLTTSSSSSNTSSSSYSSSSSSEEEQEKPTMKPSAKAREIKPISRPPSMFSPPGSRPTVDLPFLDKVSRPLSSTSASSDSDSTKESRFSGSESPSPKRPRRPRRGKSFSNDGHPRKAPSKKLKTSERGSECRLSSPSIEREKSVRHDDARASARSRARSVTTSGNMSNKCDARQRKPSKDDVLLASGSNKTPEESCKSRKLSAAERQENEKIKDEIKEETYVTTDLIKNDIKASSRDITRRSISVEEKQKPIPIDTESSTITKSSPRKTIDVKQKNIISRRMSVKSYPFKDTSIRLQGPCETITKPIRRASQSYTHSDHSSFLVNKNIDVELPPYIENTEKKIPSTVSDEFASNDKHWLPKATSPHIHPPPVEKPGDHEKYMTEDKSFDSDCTDKSSIKMIAKIQATLNENTMIKSPKTPMDARTIMLDPMEENSLSRNMRKRSAVDTEKKFIIQDVSHVQGVEISKSAKIPSTANPFPNRSMFSPQSKDTELFEFDILDDEGFNHEDIMKPFTTYPEFLFKEDSKEQGVQETLNLVDRLRMQLSTKKAAPENVPQEEAINVNEDKEAIDAGENRIAVDTGKEQEEMIIKQTTPTELQDIRSPINEIHHPNHKQCSSTDDVSPQDDIVEIVDDKDEESEQLAKESWTDMPVPTAQSDPQVEPAERTYAHTMAYNENGKERSHVHSDVQSISEVADTISLSKQSDDSQSLSVVDQSLHSNDQELSQDNQVFDNNNSLMHSDCATISPPYVTQNSKWRESKITTRRSSDSSTNSEGSVCSRKADLKSHLNSCDSHPGAMMTDIDQYAPVPSYSCPVEPSMPLNQYSNYAPDASPFLNPMSTLPLFATGACASSQLPLPSPGRGLYPSGLSFTAAPLIQPLTKPPFPLCAAFTTSSQNIALTTAMIAPPTPKPLDSPRDDIDVTGSDKFSIHVPSPTISVDSYNEASNTRPPTKMSNDSNETMSILHPQESKSPPKTAKITSKFSSKSPGKSPGISPKQSDVSKGSKRNNNRSNRSQRGRGRSKSRGQSVHAFPSTEFTGNSIQSKLVGTVYDFDEELANDGVDLKALRERRKSVDIRDNRKSDHSYKDTSQSPKVLSPQQSKTPAAEVKEIEPSIDIDNSPGSPSSKSNSECTPGFSQVEPVLPGPVDMRTYQQVDAPVPPTNDGIHCHLLAFASGTAEQPLVEIDEEVEKQLHSALMASKPRQSTSTEVSASEVIQEPIKEPPQLPKVSLSDSRNQLKVKIKGPFLDANYSTSSTQPTAPQPPAPVHDSNINIHSNTTSGSASSMMTGSTNLRRMRKKELLRQYWTQDMNMDDPANASNTGIPPPPAAPQPIPRAVITIPKAVASMTSIPTREDYKISDTPVEKKKRKVSGVNRELRHLEVTMNDDVDTSDDMKLSNYTSNTIQSHKRRGRVAIKQSKSQATSPVAPKLKIKIGSNTVQQVNDEPGFQFRPPKKRLTCSIPKPSLEDLRRESMKYRRMVMADFEENEKEKKLKLNKSEKRKKKKGKKLEKEKLQVINSENDSATKLIIKIKRKKEEEEGKSGSDEAGSSAALTVSEPPVDPFEYDPTAPDPLAIDPPCSSVSGTGVRKVRTAKLTPIRLKLARSSQGSGYVMKESVEEASSTAPATSEASAANAASATLSVPLNKHCQVR